MVPCDNCPHYHVRRLCPPLVFVAALPYNALPRLTAIDLAVVVPVVVPRRSQRCANGIAAR